MIEGKIEVASRLLKRQIRNNLKGLSENELHKIERFIHSVDSEYVSVKEDRLLSERSLDISSEELCKKNNQLVDVLAKNIEINQKLEESMSHLELIVDNLGEGLIVVDSERRVVLSNSKASIIIGRGHDALIGKHYSHCLTFVSGNKNVVIEDFIEATLKTGKEFSINRNIILIGKENKKIPVSVISSPLQKFSSKEMSCVIVFRDVTEERQLENLKNEFLSIASHELRTPMTVIKGYVSLLMKGKLGDVTQKQKGYLEKILGNTTQLINMVNDMLDVNKLEAGKMDFFYEDINITHVVQKSIGDLEELLKNKNIILTQELSEIEAYSDRGRIEQVIINYISNAYKFTGENGSIHIKLERVNKGDSFIISVEDSGIGIKKEHLGKLFKKFSQIGSHLNKTEKGTGLGLSICKEIARGMGGDVGVESIFGKGSIFSIVLPINKKPGEDK